MPENFKLLQTQESHPGLVDQGDLTIENPKETSYVDHTIFNNPFYNHDKAKASSQSSRNNKANYTNEPHEYTINHVS